MFSETETISRVPGLSPQRLQAWVARGWVMSVITERGQIFGEIDVARLRLICTLRDEMQVDRDLLPTMLKLLDQIYGLRRELRATWQAVAAEPEDIRDRILARIEPSK